MTRMFVYQNTNLSTHTSVQTDSDCLKIRFQKKSLELLI